MAEMGAKPPLATKNSSRFDQTADTVSRDAYLCDRVSPRCARQSPNGECQDARILHDYADLGAEANDQLFGVVHVDTTAHTSPRRPQPAFMANFHSTSHSNRALVFA